MDKDDINWIDVEFSFIHIGIYIILGLLTGGHWWFIFGSLIALSCIHSFRRVLRLVKSGSQAKYKL